jgi:hypothetical protein
MSNPELNKLLADEIAKQAAMTPEELKPTLTDELELQEIKSLLEAAFCEGFYAGKEGGWGSYRQAWKHSNAFTALQTKGGDT